EGKDITKDLGLNSKLLGRALHEHLWKANRAIATAKARGDLHISDPVTRLEFQKRLLSVGPPLEESEVLGAMESGELNSLDGLAILGEIKKAREEGVRLTPSQRAALGDAEQFITRGLRVKVPGIDQMTGADNLRQNQAINVTIIKLHRLLKKDPTLDPRVLAQTLVNESLGFLEPDLVQKGSIYGAKHFEVAARSIAKRLREGKITELEARFYLRAAKVLPPEPPTVKPGEKGEAAEPGLGA
ncbi:hypothetical protein LCGC14_2859850, partial [marine sediment metagenome]